MSLKKLGRYDLIRVLGKGAMGLVYEGRDPNLDRRVAIKTIKVENLSEDAAAEYEVRFRTEARSAARLQHPNIVSVYDSDRDGDIAFLVMEFVQGDDLKHHLDRGEVYTLQQTLGIMADLLSALDYAHQQKIVHRDIKPANLLVQASGSIKLADFGVARIQDSGDATRTQGSIVGTLKYMSPEQLEGRPIDARADLFAAGVVLYQLLTSQRPFDGDTDFAVIQKIVSHTPAAATFYNARLPPAIDAVLDKALAKSRDLRFSTALDFLAALQLACKQASDITISPFAVRPAKGASTTWTATMMPGESLVATESGGVAGSGTNSGTSTSLVAQEVELVYWKDIKETNDVEDLQGFLAKFPSGIYADLARRRLKVLSASTGGEPTVLLLSAATDVDKTMSLPNRDRVPVSSDSSTYRAMPNAPTEPLSKPGLTEAPAQAQSPVFPSKSVWLLAGVAAVAVVGLAFKLLSGSSPVPEASAVIAPAGSVAPMASASSGAPKGTASSPVAPALAAVPALTQAASAPGVASRAALAASKAAATVAAKNTPSEKDKPLKEAAPATSDRSPQPAKAVPAVPATGSGPGLACEGRILFSFQTCMSEQCAKPAFSQHPVCVERRVMEERRREAERNR